MSQAVQPRFLTRSLRSRVLRDRRGAVAGVVAVSATALLGLAALAAEAGVWQLQRREAVTAADLGALGGASAMERGTDPVAVARDVVSLNGFTSGTSGGRPTTVTINRPPVSGAYAGQTSAIEVIVGQTQNLGLARIVLNVPPVVSSRAVAASVVDVRVCMMALGGGIVFGGNSTVQARRCAIVSNSQAYGISVSGSTRVRTQDLVTTGACSNCLGPDVWTDDTRTARPSIIANRPSPVPDPYRPLQDSPPSPPACRGTPVAFGGNNRTATISPGEGAICSDLTVGSNETLVLNPGIYYLNAASLDVRGSISGTDVTLVFTSTTSNANVGTITVNAQADVNLSGPSTSLIPGDSAGVGAQMVIYRDARATNNGASWEAKFNGGATMRINGAIYAPTTDVRVNGNYGSSAATCMPVVGYSLNYSGTSDSTVDVSGCNVSPVIRVARLVE